MKGSSEDYSHYCVLRKYKTSTKRWRWHRFNQQRQDLLLSISVLNSKSISILVKTVHHTCKICSDMDKWLQQGWLCEALSIYLCPCFTYHAFNIIPSYLLRNIHFRHTTQDRWSHVPSLYLRLLLQFNLLIRKKNDTNNNKLENWNQVICQILGILDWKFTDEVPRSLHSRMIRDELYTRSWFSLRKPAVSSVASFIMPKNE